MKFSTWGTMAVAFLGVVLAYVIYGAATRQEEQIARAQFERDASAQENALDREFSTGLEIIHSVRAFYAGSERVDREEFKAFTSGPLERHPSVIALAFVQRVPHAERAAHEAALRDEGLAGYEIKDLTSDFQLVRAADREVYFPTVFVEPAKLNASMLGLDRSQVQARAEARARCRDDNRLAATRRLRMVQEGAERFGVLVFGPIYRNGKDVEEVEQRREQVWGYVVAAMHVELVAQRALRPFKDAQINLRLTDADGEVLYEHRAGDAAPVPFDGRFTVAGQELTVACTPTPKYMERHATATPVGLGLSVLVATALLVAFLSVLARRTARIQALVHERTAELRHVTRLQSAILDSAAYSIVATDPRGLVHTFNRAAAEMLGYDAAEVIGRKTADFLHKPDELAARAEELGADLGRVVAPGFDAIAARAALGETDHHRWTYVRRDGTEIPVRLAVTALRNDAGRVVGFLAIAHDITQRLAAERAQREARQAAEDANRSKSQFLANMSHELRTPLNAIIGYSEMLAEDAEEAGRNESVADLEKIRRSGRHLLQLINDVLDLSKIEAGRVEAYWETVDIAALVDEAKDAVEPIVMQRNNRLEVSVGDGLRVETDVTRVRQILFNLLSNAAKFTEAGRIRVSAARLGDEILLEVEDTGIGMTEEQLAHVFEPFAQADSSTTRKYGGTGLGLAICRESCRLLGGSIDVQSASDEGTRFTVRLPYRPPAAPAPAPAPATEAGETILVIDDDPAVHDLLHRMLSREGYHVEIATEGEEGLRLARELQPAAVLLDVMMPVTDGWSVLSRLKADPEVRRIPVILQTMVQDQQTGYALGAADYIVKPVERERLLSSLARCCAGGSVLVVEDDADTRELACRSLRAAGYHVDEAADGREALEALARQPCDAILLDVMMPEMDAFAFLDEVQENERWREIPVVILTAKDLSAAERERLQGRVGRILQKAEHGVEVVLDAVHKLVRQSKA